MTTRNTRFQLKNANNPNQAYPASLLLGEPIVNTADGIMLFSGNTTSTSGWTQSPSGATFFEVGSNLYNLKIRNQITSYSGITNLSGKFLSGTSNGFVLADISSITSTGSTSSPFTGGTVSGATIFTGGLSANTISATTYQNLPRDVFVSGGTYNSGTTSLTFTNTTGGTFNVTGVRGTYVESGIFYPFSGRGTSFYSYNTGGGFDVTGYTYGISTADGIENTPLYLSLDVSLGTAVRDIQVQSDGKILIVGEPFLTRLNPDGTKDTIFETNLGANFNDTVRSVRIQSDGKILVGGEFTTFDGNSIPYFIRLNSDGTQDTTFNTNLGTSFNSSVYVIRIQPDGKILVGGNFTLFDGNTVGYFTRLNSDGSLDLSFNSTLSSSFNDIVYAIELQPDGKILVGGDFTSFNGNSIPRLTRLNPDGTADTVFNSNLGSSFPTSSPNRPVFSIKIQPDNKILVGGSFNQFNTQTRWGLIRLFSDGTEDAPFYANSGRLNVVYDIQVQLDGKILVGGDFNNNGRKNIGRLLDTGVNDTIFNDNIGLSSNGTVYVVNIQTNGLIIVGGSFTEFNSIDRTNINYLYNFTQFSYDNPVGNDGSNSGRWRFITGSTSPSNPIGGNFITDSTTISSITKISISSYSIVGSNYYSWLNAVKTALQNSYSLQLQLTEVGNNSVVGIFTLSNPVDNTSYFDFDVVTVLTSNGTLSNNKEYTISWSYGVTGTGGGSSSGDYLPLSGGTVTGGTIFQSGVTANTISQTTYIDFTTGSTNPSSVAGRLFFDSTQKSLSYFDITNDQVPIAMGQQLYTRVWNATGAQIDKGKVIAITGTSNNLPSAILARNVHSVGSDRPIGVAAENIPNGSEGLVLNNGILSGITLNTFSNGDILYLSDTVPGGYVASTTSLAFTARTNEIGYVLETGTTTGKLYVNINNEDSNLTLTDIERNILEGNVISTGTYEYTGMTINSSTTVNVAPMRGWIVRNTYDYATSPDVTNLYYSGQTGITITNIATADATYVLVNSASTLYQQTTFPTPQQRRENIFLGKVVHPNRTSLLTVNNTVDYDVSPMSSLRDLWSPIKLINQGVLPSFNTGLTFNTSLGTLYGNGIGWTTNQLNPNSVTISAKTSASFFYRTQTGGTSGLVSVIDPTKYDVNGVITSVGTAGSNDATNQRIYLYPTGVINVLYGQTRYTTLTEAIANIDSETFVTYPNAETTAILIGVISVRNDIVADGQPLTNTNYAKLTLVSKFGESFGGTGGLSTTNLQQAYDNSTEPEILINSTLDGLSIQNGTGNADNVTQLLQGKNTAGTTTSFIRADGAFSGTSIYGTGLTATTISATTIYGDGSNLTGIPTFQQILRITSLGI